MLTKQALRQFTGSAVFYKAGPLFPGILFTEGMLYVAERGQAHWLIDAIASHLVTRPGLAKHRTLFWSLEVHPDKTATLKAIPDTDLPAVVTQEIEYTDFPLDSIEIWTGLNGWDVSDYIIGWTIYLPSEH